MFCGYCVTTDFTSGTDLTEQYAYKYTFTYIITDTVIVVRVCVSVSERGPLGPWLNEVLRLATQER